MSSQADTTDSSGKLAVILLTLNEAYHLGDAIENVRDIADQIFVLDSLSDDDTVSIALEKGATVIQRPFTNFGDQWNYALTHFPIETEWTLKLDPDERLTDKLLDQFRDVFKNPNSATGYSFPRQLWFMGKPLHVYQDVVRLWKTGTCEFSKVIVNEHPIIDGRVDRLDGVMEHFDSRDLHHWWDKQNFYTTLEAISKFEQAPLSAKPRLFGNALERRMFLKKYYYALPFRSSLLFLYNMIVNGAWRAGITGARWSRMRSEVQRQIQYKYLEMETTGRVPELNKSTKSARQFDERILQTPLQQKVMQLADHIPSAENE